MKHASPRETGIRWFEEIWNSADREAIRRLMSPTGIAHLEGGDAQGHEQFEAFHDQMLAGMPDLKIRILNSVGDDSQASIHWEATGTHQGTLLGMKATGKVITFTGMSFIKVQDGQLTEGWDCWDQTKFVNALSSPD